MMGPRRPCEARSTSFRGTSACRSPVAESPTWPRRQTCEQLEILGHQLALVTFEGDTRSRRRNRSWPTFPGCRGGRGLPGPSFMSRIRRSTDRVEVEDRRRRAAETAGRIVAGDGKDVGKPSEAYARRPPPGRCGWRLCRSGGPPPARGGRPLARPASLAATSAPRPDCRSPKSSRSADRPAGRGRRRPGPGRSAARRCLAW